MERTLPRLFRETVREYPEIIFQMHKVKGGTFESTSYKDSYEDVLKFAGGLLSLGICRGDHIGLISDNRCEWQRADLGLLAIGAIDIPRGCDATISDLEYILSITECKTVIVENENQVRKIIGIKENLKNLKNFIIFESPSDKIFEEAKAASIELISYEQVLEKGKKFNNENPGKVEDEMEKGKGDDLASIIFTSGTTGKPKGVMLTHMNFISQLDEVNERIYLYPGDRGLLVLPIWHAFERSVEYVVMSQAATLCYSKPIASALLEDLKTLNPQVLPAVPRVFEAIYDGIYRQMRKTGGVPLRIFNFFVTCALFHSKIDRVLFDRTTRYGMDKRWLQWPAFVIPWLIFYPLKLLGGALVFRKIRAMLGNNFRGAVAGGGALPPAVDKFFWAIGAKLVGYGLTETSPIVAVRPFVRPVLGNVGSPIRGVSVRVVDVATGKPVKRGKKGRLEVKGPTVMQGYYMQPELTAKAIDKNNWFDTGDLARLTANGEIVLCGRTKDTIVQTGGENIEPVIIEKAINTSHYVERSVVLGQDQKYVAALIVPDQMNVIAYAEENNIIYDNYEKLLDTTEIQGLFRSEIDSLVNAKTGFRTCERVFRFCLLQQNFQLGKEINAKQELIRAKINEIYKREIKKLFK